MQSLGGVGKAVRRSNVPSLRVSSLLSIFIPRILSFGWIDVLRRNDFLWKPSLLAFTLRTWCYLSQGGERVFVRSFPCVCRSAMILFSSWKSRAMLRVPVCVIHPYANQNPNTYTTRGLASRNDPFLNFSPASSWKSNLGWLGKAKRHLVLFSAKRLKSIVHCIFPSFISMQSVPFTLFGRRIFE